MSDSKKLFVGGHNDGKRIVVPPLPVIRLPLPPDMQKHWYRLETEEYRAERIETETCIFAFYVSQSISLESALERLFTHYKPKKKYCNDPDHCTYSDCPTAFCDQNAEMWLRM